MEPSLSASVGSGVTLIDGERRGTQFGERLTSLGDINGDGAADFGIPEPLFGQGAVPEGRIHIYFGRNGQREGFERMVLPGHGVSGPGDWDGDGFADVLIRCVDVGQGSAAWTELCLHRGTVTGLNQTADWSLRIETKDLSYFTVAWVGDVNGDQKTDLAIGIAGPGEVRGEVRIFFGGSGQTAPSPAWVCRGDVPEDGFGESIAGAGDVNRDGYDDLLVGAPRFDGTIQRSGRALLFSGGPSGPSTQAVWSAVYPLRPRKGVDGQADQHFGRDIAGAGDVNGDGYADVLIPACFAERGDPDEGVVFCYLGSRSGLGTEPVRVIESNQEHALLGWSVSRLGDINRDGKDDVLLGAPGFDNGQRQEGAAAIYLGSWGGLARSPFWVFESNRTVDRAGSVVVGLGDLDGDGYPDFAVNSPGYHEPPGSEDGNLGRVRLFFGSATGYAEDSGLRFVKPWSRKVDQEWRRMSSGTQWFVILLITGTLFGAGVGTREAWRRRTIVLVESREREGRLDERVRMARDLHDELGSRLSRFSLVVERVRSDARNPDATLRHTETLSATARDLRSALEQMAATLKPGGASVEGFVDELSRQAEAFLEGTEVRLRQDVPIDLPPAQVPAEIRAEMLPCLREAFANALRHSGAREVWFRATASDGILAVEVEDNGRGFDPKAASGGNGLRHFRERMARIGGEVHILSTPGIGSRVTFTVKSSARPTSLPRL